jgi:hypothetical protein
MSEQNKPDVFVEKDSAGKPQGLGAQFKLILRLLRDSRVNPLLKILPVGATIYLISPFDAGIPVVDDAVVMGLGLYTFVELCPPEIVAEHRAAIAAEQGSKSS